MHQRGSKDSRDPPANYFFDSLTFCLIIFALFVICECVPRWIAVLFLCFSFKSAFWSAIYHLRRNNVSLYKHFCVGSRGRESKSFVWLDKPSTSTSDSCLIKMTAREIKNNGRTVARSDENMISDDEGSLRHGWTNSATATSLVSRALTFPRRYDVLQRQETNKTNHKAAISLSFRLRERKMWK